MKAELASAREVDRIFSVSPLTRSVYYMPISPGSFLGRYVGLIRERGMLTGTRVPYDENVMTELINGSDEPGAKKIAMDRDEKEET